MEPMIMKTEGSQIELDVEEPHFRCFFDRDIHGKLVFNLISIRRTSARNFVLLKWYLFRLGRPIFQKFNSFVNMEEG